MSRRKAVFEAPLAAAAALAVLAAGNPKIALAAEEKGSKSPPPVYSPAPGSLAGRVVLITGANTGLGLESAKRLYASGATVVVTARTQAKADAAVDAVKLFAAVGAGASPSLSSPVSLPNKVVGVELDLANLESVKALPTRLTAALGKSSSSSAPQALPFVDVLLNNAGVMAIPERLDTSDGFERTVGVNHLGHFALFGALLPFLERAPHGFRVVTVSSEAHRFVTPQGMADALDARLDPTTLSKYKYNPWGAYGVSKAANVLFTVELDRRLKEKASANGFLGGSAVTLHPGAVQTDLPRYIVGGKSAGDTRMSETAASAPNGFLKKALDSVVLTVEKGANTQVYLSAAADLEPNDPLGKTPAALYFDNMKPGRPNKAATDPELAKRLWDLSEELTGVKIDL